MATGGLRGLTGAFWRWLMSPVYNPINGQVAVNTRLTGTVTVAPRLTGIVAVAQRLTATITV